MVKFITFIIIFAIPKQREHKRIRKKDEFFSNGKLTQKIGAVLESWNKMDGHDNISHQVKYTRNDPLSGRERDEQQQQKIVRRTNENRSKNSHQQQQNHSPSVYIVQTRIRNNNWMVVSENSSPNILAAIIIFNV